MILCYCNIITVRFSTIHSASLPCLVNDMYVHLTLVMASQYDLVVKFLSEAGLCPAQMSFQMISNKLKHDETECFAQETAFKIRYIVQYCNLTNQSQALIKRLANSNYNFSPDNMSGISLLLYSRIINQVLIASNLLNFPAFLFLFRQKRNQL